MIDDRSFSSPTQEISRRRALKRIAAGAAVVAAPIAGMQLYLKSRAAGEDRDRTLASVAEYDIQALRKVNPAQIRYRQVNRIEIGSSSCSALTTDDLGNVIIADRRTIQLIGSNFKSRDIQLSGAATSMCASGDDLFVTFRDHVEIFDGDRKRKETRPAPGNGTYLTGIAVNANSIFLADSGRRLVLHVDRGGRVIREIATPDESRGVPGLLLPSPRLSVAIAADGTIWLNNTGRHRLENYTADGNLERFWGTAGAGIESFVGCCNPTDFLLLPDGGFITAEKGIARVKHHLPDGRFAGLVADPMLFGEAHQGLALALDRDGHVLVMERGSSCIHVFAQTDGGTSA